MHLRKWCPNSENLLEIFNNVLAESHYSLHLGSDQTTSSLGLTWSTILDELMFLNKCRVLRASKTKRQLLSSLNSVFDSLGFLGPVLIHGKILFTRTLSLKARLERRFA